MKINYTTLATAALAFITPIAAQAQSPSEISEAKKAEGIEIKIPDVKKSSIKVSGYAQAQYLHTDSKGNPGNAHSGFNIRRAAISVSGTIDKNWSAEVGFEIDGEGKAGSKKLTNAFVDKALIAYKNDYGKLTAGYQKTNFVLEEYTSSKRVLFIEQSIASSYFNKISSLSGRHGGIWWDGKAVDGLKYTVAITNQYKEDMDSDSNKGVAFYGTLAYEYKTDDLNLELGINGVYNPGNDSSDNLGAKAPKGSIYGFEPYAKITVGGFSGVLDILYADGSEKARKDAALGMNLSASYKFENGLEPVIRGSYIDVGDNKDLGPDLMKYVPKGTSDHDSAYGAYIGANYYVNKNIKISAGYEYTKFDGGAKSEDANAFRIQMQTTF